MGSEMTASWRAASEMDMSWIADSCMGASEIAAFWMAAFPKWLLLGWLLLIFNALKKLR